MPFNPQAQNQVPEILMRAAENFGRDIGGGIQSFMEKRKREADDIARSRKMLKMIGEDEGLDDTAIEAMSGPELMGTLEGLQLKRSKAGQQLLEQTRRMDMQLKQYQMRDLMQQQAQRDQRAAQAGPWAGRMSELMQEQPAMMAPPRPARAALPGPQAMLQSAQEFPAMAPQAGEMDDFMRMLRDAGGDGELPIGKTMQLPDGTTIYGTGGAPQFRFPEKPATAPQLFPANDPGTGKPIPGMALTAGGGVVQTGEKGGLKDLSQTEVDRIAALNQAAKDMDRIEQLFGSMSDAGTGPVVGRARSMNPYDESRAVLEQAVNAAVPNLARGVFREVGVLTDEDVKRYAKQFPTLTDPPDTRRKKLAQLRTRIKEGEKTTMDELRKAGRDVTGFDKSTPPAAEGPMRYQTEDAARKSGAKSGDVIELYLPERGGYVKVKLK